MNKIIPCLWFDGQAEEAAKFYTSIFPNSKIGNIVRYTASSSEVSGQKIGSVMTVEFSIDGNEFLGLNGGSDFRFTEAISFIVHCKNQEEVDHYWTKLTEGGNEVQCGWLKDKFGVSWQITPTILEEMIADPDPVKAERVMKAMIEMVKIDIPTLQKAYDGK